MSGTLNTIRDGAVVTVTLNRPEARNALNPAMMDELTGIFHALGDDPTVRVVILAAAGGTFCAGGDLRWMQEAAGYTFDENVEDARRLARMFRTVYECPKPVVGRVQGAAFGGGVGLVAVCDMVAAVESASLCFSEVKLGLLPAVISPFVVRKVPPGVLRRYFLTAERLAAVEACGIGLVSEVVTDEASLDAQVADWTAHLTLNGPEALAASKRLLDETDPVDWDALLELAARRIAERRVSEEGREGIRAFFEKRAPNWCIQEPPTNAEDPVQAEGRRE